MVTRTQKILLAIPTKLSFLGGEKKGKVTHPRKAANIQKREY
jgi:hypothetical protein